MTWIEPLDIETLIVHNLAGGLWIFLFIAMIGIAYVAARFRMPNMITLLMVAVFVVIFSAYFTGLLILFLVIAGLIIGFILSKFGKN